MKNKWGKLIKMIVIQNKMRFDFWPSFVRWPFNLRCESHSICTRKICREWLWRYEWWCWRLDDVMVEWSTEKRRCTIPNMPNILWKWLYGLFWDNRATKFYRNCFCFYIQKQFLTRGNLSCWQIKVICFHRMNRTFDRVPDIRLKIGDHFADSP